MANNESLKVSKQTKEFLGQVMINRIKLDQTPLASYSEAIELMQRYFKIHNKEYHKMLKEERE